MRIGGCERREGRLKDKGKRLKDKRSAFGQRSRAQGPLAWKLECLEAGRLKAHGVRRKAKGKQRSQSIKRRR